MTLIITFMAVFALGNDSGWLIHSWKSGTEVALVKSEKKSLGERNGTLVASNPFVKWIVMLVALTS